MALKWSSPASLYTLPAYSLHIRYLFASFLNKSMIPQKMQSQCCIVAPSGALPVLSYCNLCLSVWILMARACHVGAGCAKSKYLLIIDLQYRLWSSSISKFANCWFLLPKYQCAWPINSILKWFPRCSSNSCGFSDLSYSRECHQHSWARKVLHHLETPS